MTIAVNDNNNTPKWFTPVSIVALLWNLMGVSAFIMQMLITPDAIAELTAQEAALYENIPMWVNVAFALAVFGGAFGSLLLVMKKQLALPVLAVSLLGIVAQMYHAFFISNSFEVYGPGGMVMPILVIIIGVALCWLSYVATKRSWLN